MHGGDATLQRRARRREVHLLSINTVSAGSRLIDARQDANDCRFPGTVVTEEKRHLTTPYRNEPGLQSNDSTKTHESIADLNLHYCASPRRLRTRWLAITATTS